MGGHQDDYMGIEIPVGLPQQPLYEKVEQMPFDDYSLLPSHPQPGYPEGFTTIDHLPLQPQQQPQQQTGYGIQPGNVIYQPDVIYTYPQYQSP